MKLTLETVYSSWNRFFRNPDCLLLRLPEEVLVDEVFNWLSVRDIVRLRQVCKALAVLTKKPAIWKRFLPYITQLQQHLAPLPPTQMYNISNLTGREMEMVVSRAVSYDMTWKRQKIEYQGTFAAYVYQRVEEMVILPGGHFVVMSLKTPDGVYSIALWSLEHRAAQKPAPLLFRRTEVKAYGLKAKYMEVGCVKGISIAFLRKRHKENDDTRYIPETFEMGGKEDQEDPYMPLKYECTVLHVHLGLIDLFNDRKCEPMTDEFATRIKWTARAHVATGIDIWQSTARIRTGAQLGVISLDVIDGHPYVCVVKRPNKIVFQPFGPFERSTLECMPVSEYEDTHHSIWNFRVLPEQNQVLVVRNISANPELGMEHDLLVIETYRIPDYGETIAAEAMERLYLTSRPYLNVQISEVHRTIPSHEDDSITPRLNRGYHLHPLSIFLRTRKGMAHHSIWPVEVRPSALFENPTAAQQASRHFVYDLYRSEHIFIGDQDDTLSEEIPYDEDGVEDSGDRDGDNAHPPVRRKDDALRFLPGARRAFVYAIPRSFRSTQPPVTACWGFQYNRKDYTYFLGNSGNTDEDLENVAETEGPEATMDTEIPEDDDGPYHPSLDVPHKPMGRRTMLGCMRLPPVLQSKLALGVSAVCFDEDTGRAVFATKADNCLHVVDFARVRSHDGDDVVLNEAMDKAFEREAELLEIPDDVIN